MIDSAGAERTAFVCEALDVVALLSDVPAPGLLRGQVGTIVELLDGAYEVEFSDDEGKTYGHVIGFEKLNFTVPDSDSLRVALETAPA